MGSRSSAAVVPLPEGDGCGSISVAGLLPDTDSAVRLHAAAVLWQYARDQHITDSPRFRILDLDNRLALMIARNLTVALAKLAYPDSGWIPATPEEAFIDEQPERSSSAPSPDAPSSTRSQQCPT